MTDEIDDAQPNDTTVRPELPDTIARLGIEAQAEYLRARQRLGLSLEPVARLGTVGRYRLEEEIGRGGMGIVYRARDPELDRAVAIKLVQAQPFAHYDRLRARLLKEAKVLAKLTHPNVVRVYDCGQHEGEVYLAMEYVEGSTLRRWQQEQPHRSILDAYAKAARGLAAAHDLDIIHRDFKPDNVLVASDGRVLVGDFGLAGLVDGGDAPVDGLSAEDSEIPPGSATRTGALLGTPTYMAPEQLRGELATPSSDQFAFCVSLWEALTGDRPFEAEAKELLLEQIEGRKAVGTAKIPRRLRGRLLKGLAVDPQARFEHVGVLADAIEPRRSVMTVGVVLVLVLTAGLLAGRLLGQEPTDDVECDLSDSLAPLQELSQSAEVQERFAGGLRPTYERLRGHIDELQDESERFCRLRDVYPMPSREQQIEGWISFLRHLLEKSGETETPRLLLLVDELEGMLASAPPPRALDPGVNELLLRQLSSIMDNETADALSAAEQAIALAGDRDLELAAAQRSYGRTLTLLTNRDTEAAEAYRQALVHADAAAYDDERLVTELLFAETSVMRLGETDRAEDILFLVPGLLRRLEEPWFGQRRSDYHEILASVLKRKGDFDAAFAHQRFALLLRYLRLDIREISNGHVNLGNIHDLSTPSEPSASALLHYEIAFLWLERNSLRQSPEWFQAAFNLGRRLAQSDDALERRRAKALLEKVNRDNEDLRMFALTELVLLEVGDDDPKAAVIARALEAMLENGAAELDEKVSDAWGGVAVAHAMVHDLPAFEAARDRFVQSLQGADDADWQLAALSLQAATTLEDFAPDRARELAESTRTYLLSLPESERPGGMLEAAEEILQ
ncbi:MAG: serine/threonine-protein kinase [Nannocystaceae bacterium]